MRQKSFFRFTIKLLIFLRRKISKPITLVAAIISVFVVAAIFIGANFVVELAHDPELSELIPNQLLFWLIAAPAGLIYFNLLIFFRIVLDRIMKKPGTLLRFRITGFLFFAFAIPAIIFVIFFTQVFDFTFNSLNNPLLLKKMRQELNSSQVEMKKSMEMVKREMTTAALQDFNFFIEKKKREDEQNSIDIISYHKENGFISSVVKMNNQKSYPNYFPYLTKINFDLLLSKKDSYTSYEENLGMVYSIVKKEQGYITATKFLGEEEQKTITELLTILKQLRQLELLTGPLKLGIFIFILYFYIQIFCATVIVFYYLSNSYLTPLQDLISAIRILSMREHSKEAFSEIRRRKIFSKLNYHIKKMKEDEVRNLLQSFTKMLSELEQNRMRIARMSEIEGWREVAKRVAHEIKNPLTPIKLTVNHMEKILIKENFETYEKLLSNFNLINNEIEHISKLIDEFSAFSKNTQMNKQWCKLSDILENINQFLLRYQDLELKTSFAKLPIVFIDPKKIHQLLLNLVKNSLESLNEKKDGEKKKIFLRSRLIRSKKNQFIEICVMDNGKGIPPQKREEIFKPYFTLKEKGTGLGLAICQQIALNHDAELFLEAERSDQDMTCFILRLPLKNEKLIYKNKKKLSPDSIKKVVHSKTT